MSPTDQQMRRKLSAVLMADIVGYSTLMERDEVRTYAIVQSCLDRCIEPAIQTSNGRLVRRMGDGFLAVFESATDAVQCAMEIQLTLAKQNQDEPEGSRLRLRIGINLGDVIHEGDDIFGDGVNIAARLQSLAPPEGILISEFAYREACRNLNYRFDYIGKKKLKNILEPAATYLVKPHSDEISGEPSSIHARSSSDLAEVPTIAVLPFTNLGVERISSLFIDGFVDDLITDLSRFRTLSVIARTSSFKFRDANNTAGEIGRLLGAQYVVEGTIRQLGDNIRIVVQLIDVESESHLWAERYDASLDDAFALQDNIISEIVGALERALVIERLEVSKRSPVNELRAYDLWLQGNKLLEEWSSDSDAQAVPLFEKAIEIDPTFARAYSSLAGVYGSRTILKPGNPSDTEDRNRGLEYARHAVALDPGDARNHLNLAWSYMIARDFRRAAKHFDLAGKLNPHDSDVLISRAVGSAFLGKCKNGLEMARRAIRLNPFYPDFYLGNLTIVRFLVREYTEAAETAEQVLSLWPEITAWLAASHAQAGNLPAAQEAAEQFVDILQRTWCGPDKPSEADFVRWLFHVNPIEHEDDRSRLLEALVRSGLPRIDLHETALIKQG